MVHDLMLGEVLVDALGCVPVDALCVIRIDALGVVLVDALGFVFVIFLVSSLSRYLWLILQFLWKLWLTLQRHVLST